MDIFSSGGELCPPLRLVYIRNYGCLVDVNTCKRNAAYDSESSLAFCDRLPWSTYTDPPNNYGEEVAAWARRIKKQTAFKRIR
jgi:hypothetical protein